MKRFLKIVCALLLIVMMQSLSMPMVFGADSGKNIKILFTHDMHDHLLPFNMEQGGNTVSAGGYARLYSAVLAEKQSDPNLLLLDAGDFSMGTLFQTIYASDAPELRVLGKMGYDVVTLGNHEFDFRPEGLANSLNAAKKSGDTLPQIVASNITYPADKNGQMTQSLSNLKDSMNNYGVRDYTIIERNGVKIGIFGLMGKDADDSAPMAEVKFTGIVESAKRVVNILKQQENADLVICLSHSGTSTDKSTSEDEILAKEVPQIDVIISGHTHTRLDSPIIAGKTIIGSCGENGENLGILNITQNDDKSWKFGSYSLKKIDSSLPEDEAVAQAVESFKGMVQEKYLSRFNLQYDQVLANSPFNFVPSTEVGKKHGEDTLGNLLSDSYVYAVKKAEGSSYKPVAATIVPAGIIRGSFVKGDITVSDVFNISSLGIGPDKVSGYPLISVYITGKELKTACEVDASVTPMMSSAQLYMSGVSYTFNPNRLIFNKVTDAALKNPDGTLEKIDDNKLYRVVTGLYSAQMLSVVGEKSFGLLSIVPKTSDGKPIKDFEAQVIKENSDQYKGEIKEWLAVAEYLQSFEKVNDVSQIPQNYNKIEGRKIINNDSSLAAFFSSPNSIAIAAYAIVIIIIALIIFVIARIATRKRRRQRRINSRRRRRTRIL